MDPYAQRAFFPSYKPFPIPILVSSCGALYAFVRGSSGILAEGLIDRKEEEEEISLSTVRTGLSPISNVQCPMSKSDGKW